MIYIQNQDKIVDKQELNVLKNKNLNTVHIVENIENNEVTNELSCRNSSLSSMNGKHNNIITPQNVLMQTTNT